MITDHDRIDELEEENRQLRDIMGARGSSSGLTPLRAAILGTLSRRGLVTGEDIAATVTTILERDVSARSITLAVFRMRHNPRMADISGLISSRERVGYWMTEENKALWRARKES